MEQKIKILEDLKDKLYLWKSYNEEDLEKIMSAFEKFPRKEFSTFYIPILTDTLLAEHLVAIGKTFPTNTCMLINIISSIGNMVWRYKLYPSDKVFNFFKEATTLKKVNYYVSLNISSFPQYSSWKERWDYLISIPNISPKRKSIENFHTEVKKILSTKEKIPFQVTKELLAILKKHINTT
ncbi:hypothetical protein, partial [Capnocytophaga granulosa]|uniref:hypothetical protein n=1 Tax=Capnocytophaga granulosa TaxID=45242 RepID=UPI00361217F6